jgi:hypothetical protein
MMFRNFPFPKAVQKVLEVLAALIVCAALYFFMLPPINVSSTEFWIFSVSWATIACFSDKTFALGILGFTSIGIVGAFKKGNRPCAQGHKDGKQSYDLPPSAGFTAFATCCLWNALVIISNCRDLSIGKSRQPITFCG